MLRQWNCELRLLPNFKFRRFGKKHLRDALQKTEKQSRAAVDKSAHSTKSEKNKALSAKDNKTEAIKSSNIESKELNTILPENTALNECLMDIE